MDQAIDWIARSVTEDGIAPLTDKKATVRYFPWNCGPVFNCRYNGSLSCAWGGTKVLLALGKIPAQKRTPQVESSIETAVDFFLPIDPLKADYPTRLDGKPSPNWWKLSD